MVKALQANGHVVAMTGDGVNDALALKDADLGVAMGSGAPATRAVAQLVLLDGRFSQLPVVLAEGRRVIANVERVATLFVVKNVMSAVLSIVSIVSASSYPMLPRHLSLLSTLTIGIPAFFLALAPNQRRYVPGFLTRVIRNAVPWGVIMACSALGAFVAVQAQGVQGDELRAATLHATMLTAFTVLAMVARPWRPWKLGLVATAAAVHVMLSVVPYSRDVFALATPPDALAGGLAVAVVASVAVVAWGWRRTS
jgi:cation-transporting ATPase E